MKKALAIVLSVLMLISLCACSGVSLEGTEWKLTSMEVDGLVVDEEFVAGMGVEGRFTFGDKQATSYVMGESEVVDYTIKDNVVTMTSASGVTMVGTIEGDTLTIDMGADGIMIFTKE